MYFENRRRLAQDQCVENSPPKEAIHCHDTYIRLTVYLISTHKPLLYRDIIPGSDFRLTDPTTN